MTISNITDINTRKEFRMRKFLIFTILYLERVDVENKGIIDVVNKDKIAAPIPIPKPWLAPKSKASEFPEKNNIPINTIGKSTSMEDIIDALK